MEQGEIILYQPDEAVKLEVRLEDETVWPVSYTHLNSNNRRSFPGRRGAVEWKAV